MKKPQIFFGFHDDWINNVFWKITQLKELRINKKNEAFWDKSKTTKINEFF